MINSKTFFVTALFVLVSMGGVSAQDWVGANTKSAAGGALQAGNEADGSPVYIIRAPFEGGLTPGKFIPKSKGAYVPWGGVENPVVNFELYVGKGRWVALSAGQRAPDNAVVGGQEADGTPLLLIRAPQGKALVPGKYNSATGQAYIPWGGNELEVKKYEILVVDRTPPAPAPAPAPTSPEWVPVDTSNNAAAAVAAGTSPDGTPSFLIRALFQGDIIPGKFNPKAKSAYVPWGGKENPVKSFELYVGRGVWLPYDARQPIPPNAVPAGQQSDGTTLFAIRSKVDKALVPGKLHGGTHDAFVSIGGKEVKVTSLEILVRQPSPSQARTPDPVPDEPEFVGTGAEDDDLITSLWRAASSSKALAPVLQRPKGGVISLTGALDDKDFALNSKAVDAYRFELDINATFNLSVSGVAKPSEYRLFLLDSRGAPVGMAETVGNFQRFWVEQPVRGPLFLFVLQAGAKAPGRYGFDLQETSFSLEGDLEGDAFNQESLIPMAFDPSYGQWSFSGNGAFGPFFDEHDSQGKVLARSEIVDDNDHVAQLNFSPKARGMGDLRMYTMVPTERTHWSLFVSIGSGR